MAEITRESFPAEYERPPVYQRPYGGIVKVMERQLKDGETQTTAYQEAQPHG